MRRLILAATAVAALAGAGSLVSTRADAMPGLGGLGGAIAGQALTEQVRLVCQRTWNGYRWVRTCYETGPRYYDGGSRYYGGGGYDRPRPYYGGGGYGGGYGGY